MNDFQKNSETTRVFLLLLSPLKCLCFSKSQPVTPHTCHVVSCYPAFEKQLPPSLPVPTSPAQRSPTNTNLSQPRAAFPSMEWPVLAGWFIWHPLICQEQGRRVRKHCYNLLFSLPSRWEEDRRFPLATTVLCIKCLSPQLFLKVSSRDRSVGNKMVRS